ncbi:hypothetical protein H2204_004424 [Knufia peltigerae]|uniref:Pre-mRNA-splicing factor SPF27 n=1 Tax=Knufia peltigerae TaxID=1002370 RepID=A0AA39D0P7_9EURO|nr:hypothetical protein H2204_004424 [Knufia peltigerae]
MSLVLESNESLAYIDPEPTAAQKERARVLIDKELPADYLTTPHPSLPPLHETKFSELMSKELERVAVGQPMQGGIDMGRYEAPENEDVADLDVQAKRCALRQAYVASTFLSGRQDNLQLLDEYGKNAWLVSNDRSEEILKDLERTLARLKSETDVINKSRKVTQEAHKAELFGLQDAWRRGIGQILEIEVATEELRHLIYDRQHQQHTR